LGLPHPIVCGFFFMHRRLAHKFDKDTPPSLCSWGRMHYHTWCKFKILLFPLLRILGSMFCMNKLMFF
jgi:hypothetical protein